jgi:hypothetical protein
MSDLAGQAIESVDQLAARKDGGSYSFAYGNEDSIPYTFQPPVPYL